MKKNIPAAKAAKTAKAAQPVQSAKTAGTAKAGARNGAHNGAADVWHPKPHPPRKRPPKDNLAHVADALRALGPNFYVPGRPLPKPRRPDSTYP